MDADNATPGASTTITSKSPAEDYVVLTVNVRRIYFKHNMNAWVADCTSGILGKRAKIEIPCLVTTFPRSLAVFTSLTEPCEWCTYTIEPLPTGKFFSPSLVSWVYLESFQSFRSVHHVGSDIQHDFTSLYVCKLQEKKSKQESTIQKSYTFSSKLSVATKTSHEA